MYYRKIVILFSLRTVFFTEEHCLAKSRDLINTTLGWCLLLYCLIETPLHRGNGHINRFMGYPFNEPDFHFPYKLIVIGN